MASTQQSTFLLSAANVSWGRRQCYSVVLDSGDFTAGQYFTVSVPSENFGAEAAFYVWASDGVAADPAPGGTGIAADISAAVSEADRAQAIATALEANASFRSSVDPADASGLTVIMEAQFKGPISTAAADVDSNVSITEQVSGLGGDLGRTTGGIEVTLEAQTVDITADQSAQLVLDRVFTGSSVEATMSFLEVTPERFKTIVGSVTGDSFTPSGGTELTGYGESRLYASFFDLGGELVLHPTRLPASDRSRDITFWKSAPQPASINFSGEEPQALEVTFAALADRTVVDEISQMAFGDSEQDVRK